MAWTNPYPVFKVTQLFGAKYLTNGYRYGHSYYRPEQTNTYTWNSIILSLTNVTDRQNSPVFCCKKSGNPIRLRTFAPSCIGKYQERKFQGAKVPHLELSLRGANCVGSKKSRYKDTDLVLYSLTTVRAFSFQSSIINSDILSSIHKTTRTTIARQTYILFQHDENFSEKNTKRQTEVRQWNSTFRRLSLQTENN